MDFHKRSWLTGWAAAATALLGARTAHAAGFPGDEPTHKVVYQINDADPAHIEHILNSISAVLGKYVDDVAVAIVAFGPGIHLLATQPGRPMPEVLRQRVKGMADNYGVQLIACGNTMKSLKWGRQDIIAQAEIEQVGAAALMELQEKGYSYIAW
jgi:intracellular sulfur oxidation DsrE/DsrF family protein